MHGPPLKGTCYSGRPCSFYSHNHGV